MANKYEKKNTFSREKKPANSEADILKKDMASQQFKDARASERARNLRLANGIAEPEIKTEPVPKISPRIMPKGPMCKCGISTGTVPWFSPEGEKWILCDDCYRACEDM